MNFHNLLTNQTIFVLFIYLREKSRKIDYGLQKILEISKNVCVIADARKEWWKVARFALSYVPLIRSEIFKWKSKQNQEKSLNKQKPWDMEMSRCSASSCSSSKDIRRWVDTRGNKTEKAFRLQRLRKGCQEVAQRNPKGQLISKCPFGVIVWTKLPTKNLTNFCPRI